MKLITPNKLTIFRIFLAFVVMALLLAIPYLPQLDQT
jgi:phosphatidylglycerophosphate synthase